MTFKTIYYIRLKDGFTALGTAGEIVSALRKSSLMDHDTSKLVFKMRFSRRHKIAYGKRLHVLIDRDFIEDLGSSPAVAKFMRTRSYEVS